MRFISLGSAIVGALVLGSVSVACSGAGSSATTNNLSEVTFHTDGLALPGVKQDTGLQPPGSPVQLQLTVEASGKSTVDASAYASGSSDAPALTAKLGSGKVALSGGFAVTGRLVVKQPGLPSYDGPIPGLDNMNLSFSGEATFDPFLVSGGVATATASIPPVNLPDIPLPGGLPGSLKIKVGEGSTVSLAFSGTCAAISGTSAAYAGTITRSGKLILHPTIELKIPAVGTKAFPLPDVTVPIAAPAEAVKFDPQAVTFGEVPPEGQTATVGTCGATTAGNGREAGTTTDASPNPLDATDALVVADSDASDSGKTLDASDAGAASDADAASDSAPGDSGKALDGGDGGVHDGGDAGAIVSCDAVNTCATATRIGAVSGDKGADIVSNAGYLSTWLKVDVTEDDTSWVSGQDLSAQFSLGSPVGSNYDLYVFDACNSVIGQSTTPTGTDSVTAGWADQRPAHDDTKTLYVYVKYQGGDCKSSSPWNLQVSGNAP